MRVLVLGAGGMLGHVLAHRLATDCDVVATSRVPLPEHVLPRSVAREAGVVAEDLATVVAVIARHRPEAVLNAVGLIKHRRHDPIDAITINALFPHQLARACGDAGARLVHFSTDCVFSGRRGGYREADEPDPVDLYGRTKHLGELDAPCLTVRSSFIGPELSGKRGLFEWLRAQRGRVTGYAGAVYSGLTTMTTADIVARVLREQPDLAGVWQVASRPIDKHALLVLLRDAFALDVEIVSVAEPRIDRSLDGGAFTKQTTIGVPEWPAMIDNMRRFINDNGSLYDHLQQ